MSEEPRYWNEWYESVQSGEILQGDIFRAMRAYWLPPNLPRDGDPDSGIKVLYSTGNWIVLSASCELARDTNQYVLFARVFDAIPSEVRNSGEKDFKSKLEVIRRGNDPVRFLLARNPDADPAFGLSFAYYRHQTLLPIDYARAHCDRSRLRLRPPFREKFGAWAAMNIGQVGIRDDLAIPRFVPGISSSDIVNATERD